MQETVLEARWREQANSQDKSDACWQPIDMPNPKPTVWGSAWEYGIRAKHYRYKLANRR